MLMKTEAGGKDPDIANYYYYFLNEGVIQQKMNPHHSQTSRQPHPPHPQIYDISTSF